MPRSRSHSGGVKTDMKLQPVATALHGLVVKSCDVVLCTRPQIPKTTKPKKASVKNQKVKLAGSAGVVRNIK